MQDLWLEMKAEFQELGAPGKIWHKEIQLIAQRRIRRLTGVPPATFGLTDWNKDDLTQMVITERLIGRGQASYIYEVADSIDDARRLLATELNFSLEDIRVPNQVDNIWANLSRRLMTLGWSPKEIDPSTSKELNSKSDEVVRLIINQKRLKNQGIERLSPIFAGGVLDKLAGEIIELDPNFPTEFLRTALRTALTIISPALSIRSVGTGHDEYQKYLLSKGHDEDLLEGNINEDGNPSIRLAEEILEQLVVEDIEIFFQLAKGASQSDIGRVLGVSRPKAVERIAAFTNQFNQILENMAVDNVNKKEVFRGILDLMGAGMNEGELIK